MNKFFISVVSAAAFCGAAFADGIEFKLEKPADWQKNGMVKWVGEKKDVMQISGRTALYSSKAFDVDPAKKYYIEADVKVISGGPATTYLGFYLYDKNNRVVAAQNVSIVLRSETVFAKAAKKGDTVVTLKANPLWKKMRPYALALNPKKDYSDLPNFDLLYIKSVKEAGANVEVTLKAPVKKEIAAGTSLRLHLPGGYMYTGGWKKLAAGQKAELKGMATGRCNANISPRAWAPGVAKARVIMLVNWDNPKTVAQIDDVELKIK